MKISLLLTILLGVSTNAYADSSETPQFLRGIAVEGNNDQCNNLGASCNVDDDCLQGGYNPCNSCGQSHGTQYYKRCYYTPPPTPAPYEQPQCYNLGQTCDRDSDCRKGGFNPCTTCGGSKNDEYYHRCYTPDETPRPTPSPNEPGMCRVSCYNDSDCKSEYAGTYNPCMLCSRNHGAAAGTRYMCIEPPETPSPTPTDDDDWDRTNSQPCNYKDTHKGGTGCRVPGQICVKSGDLPCETDNTYNGCCVPADDWLNEMNELMEQSSV